MEYYQGLVDKYRARLPLAATCCAVSLHEGNTPLIPLDNIARNLSTAVKLYAKYEGLNPTGSFKDRGMTVAVTHAKFEGAQAVICASTGNTSAAAAAYAARAGMQCFVIIPEGKIALGKLAQARMHGAIVIQIAGNFDEGLAMVREVAREVPVTIVNSINPYRLQGQKTAAFEIIEALGDAPDYHALPVGNAGNISAYWMGYQEYYQDSLSSKRPIMCGYQAAGAAPFIKGEPITDPETVATAIRIGAPQSWALAAEAQQSSGGWFAAVADAQILAAQKLLAQQEGVFCEPASAAALAGFLQDEAHGKIAAGAKVVMTLTGHGLKDPDIAISECREPLLTVPATLSAVRDAISARLANHK